jgi:hypothetical protein
MPCCAFAAFILGQILIGFDAFKRFVLRRSDSAVELPINPATAWRLDGEVSSRPSPVSSRARRGVRWLAVAASLEIALATMGAYGLRTGGHHLQAAFGADVLICRNPSASKTR